MFKLHKKKVNLFVVLLVGYIGSIGIATLSDCVIPYAGEVLLGFHVEAHAHDPSPSETSEIHHRDNSYQEAHLPPEETHQSGLHFGFIERWYIINPLAILGSLLAYFRPRTKLPHAGHVLLSIWASLAHILMAMGTEVSFAQWLGVGVFLFLAVWLPCCVSDIVFPLLFVKPGEISHVHCH